MNFVDVSGHHFDSKTKLQATVQNYSNDTVIHGFAACCGAAAVPSGADVTWWLKYDRNDSYDTTRVGLPNKGVLLLPGHVDREFIGNTPIKYDLDGTKFTLVLADKDVDTYWNKLPRFTPKFQDDCPSKGRGSRVLWLSYAATCEEVPVVDPRLSGTIYTNYYAGVSSVEAGHIMSLDSYVKYGYAGGEQGWRQYCQKFKIIVEKQLNENFPVLFILTMDQIEKFKRELKEYGLDKYLIGEHRDVYNLNYKRRRLNVFVLYKGKQNV